MLGLLFQALSKEMSSNYIAGAGGALPSAGVVWRGKTPSKNGKVNYFTAQRSQK